MNKCVFLIAYFGQFNNYFQLFLNSCGKNKNFDWIIYTDDRRKFNYPSNVYVKYCSFYDIKTAIQKKYSFKIVLNKPYELCDYKIAYGDIFEDDIKEYDFWGFCDTDLIFGNLSIFVTDYILENYDRILARGHLTLFRNNSLTKQLYKSNEESLFLNYKYAFTTNYTCHFDEFEPWIEVCNKYGIRQWIKTIFADINCNKYTFDLVDVNDNINNQIFTWINGTLKRVYIDNGIIKTDEWAYIHLQKRNMSIDDNIEFNNYVIKPNIFVNNVDIKKILFDIEKVSWNKKLYLSRKIRRLCEIITNIKKGALFFRWKKLVSKI